MTWAKFLKPLVIFEGLVTILPHLNNSTLVKNCCWANFHRFNTAIPNSQMTKDKDYQDPRFKFKHCYKANEIAEYWNRTTTL